MFQHYHHYFFERHLSASSRRNPINKFYFASLLHDLGFQMLSLFVLFYLYQLGWSLLAAAAYILVFVLLRPLFQYLSSLLIIKFGVQRTILLGNIFRILFAITIFNLGAPSFFNYVLFGSVILLDVASYQMYYSSWDFYFSGMQRKEQSGQQLSLTWLIMALTGFLAPLISGLLAQVWGFKTSVVFASIFLVLSVVPLILIKHKEPLIARVRMKKCLNFKSYLKIFQQIPKKGLLSFTASNLIFSVFLPLWMLYLAVEVLSGKVYGGLGILMAISALATIAVSLLVGKFIDAGRNKPVLRSSALVEFLLSGMRFFVVNIPMAGVHNFLQQQSWAHNIINFRWYYEQKQKSAERLAFFQVCSFFQALIHGLIVVIIVACLLIFSNSQPEVLRYACIVLGLFSPLMLGLTFKKASN